MLYLFACVSPACIKRSDCVKAFRVLIHDRNKYVKFASDADYRFVIDKQDSALKTSRFASFYDNLKEEIKEIGTGQEDGSSDDDEMEDSANTQAATTMPIA